MGIDPQTARATIARALAERLSQVHGETLISVVLFGSVARGTAHGTSDIDLLLVFRALPHGHEARFRVFWDALGPIELERRRLASLGVHFDWSPILMTAEEATHLNRLYLDMVDEAVLLVDRDGFFAGVLERMRARLAEIGATRHDLPDGSHYWDLNPRRLPPWEVVL